MLLEVGLFLIYHFAKENECPIPSIKTLNDKCRDKDFPNSVGLYHYEQKLIQVFLKYTKPLSKVDFVDKRGTSCLSTILHEYGHYLFHLQSLRENIDIENYAINIYGEYTHQYSGDRTECFANDFVIFILNPMWLKKYRPLVYSFFVDVLKYKKLHNLSYLTIRKIIKQLN